MGVDPSLAKAILGGGLLPLRFGTAKGCAVLGRVSLPLGTCLRFTGAAEIYQLSSQSSTGGSSND
jgi:hypothetical protein